MCTTRRHSHVENVNALASTASTISGKKIASEMLTSRALGIFAGGRVPLLPASKTKACSKAPCETALPREVRLVKMCETCGKFKLCDISGAFNKAKLGHAMHLAPVSFNHPMTVPI